MRGEGWQRERVCACVKTRMKSLSHQIINGASLGKSKGDDITNQLKALKAEDRSANPLLRIKRTISQPATCHNVVARCSCLPVALRHPHTEACLLFGGQHRARERGVSTERLLLKEARDLQDCLYS